MDSNSSFRAMLLALVLTLTGCLHDTPSEENFWGVELPGEAAADFTLVDQYGNNFSFNETTGKIVVMTFIYTSCPDVCPLVTYQLSKLQEALGADYGERVEILSITVDPERDTVERLALCTSPTGDSTCGMMANASWPHLTSNAGMPDMAMNSSVWTPYDIYVEKVGAEKHEHDESSNNETGDNEDEGGHDGHNETGDNEGNETDDEGDDDYGVNHSTILYIIDQQGRLRVAWPGLDWTYRDIHHDVVLLLD